MQTQIPTEILDLLSQKDFSALTAKESAFVLQHLSQTEYEVLHQSYQQTATYLQTSADIAPSDTILGNLQTQFDKKNSHKSFLLQPIPLWKAVAAVLLLAFVWMAQLYFSSTTSQSGQTVYVPVHDTVTVKVAQVEKQIDTVIQYLQEVVTPKKNTTHTSTINNNKFTESQLIVAQKSTPIAQQEAIAIQVLDDVHTLNPADFDKALYKMNGKSREEDSLYKRFGFVSM